MSIDKFGRTEFGKYFYDPYATSATTGELYVRTDGNSTIISDIDFNSHKIINLGEPTSAHDAATKNYVDTHSSGGGGGIGTITSDLDLNSHKLINVSNPASAQDAATKNYVDTTLNAGLSLAQKSNYIGIDANSGLSSLGLKYQTLPVGTADATSIFTY